MNKIILQRYRNHSEGTQGLVMAPGFWCYSLELPWNGNLTNQSCIPPGQYRCCWVQTRKFGACYQVMNVPGRSGILIHSGNTIDDSWGCILLGKKTGHLDRKRAVLLSKPTTRSFNQLFNHNDFQLEVYDA